MKKLSPLPLVLFFIALGYTSASFGMSWLAFNLPTHLAPNVKLKDPQAKPEVNNRSIAYTVTHQEYEPGIIKSVLKNGNKTEIVLATNIDTTDQATHGVTYCSEIGFALLEEQHYLHALGVQEQYRSSGYATKLFNEAGKFCHSNGKPMYGFAKPFKPYKNNKKALTQEQVIAFYKKRGAIFRPGTSFFMLPAPSISKILEKDCRPVSFFIRT